jgi:cold shock CspA family protein
MSSSSNVSSSAQRTTGRVKWFNNKAGYGFITATTGAQAGTDVFAHHSGLAVSNQQYRYLVQGEYVEFQMNSVEGGAHRFQAADITGIGRGMLMCETRRTFREGQQSSEQETQSAPPTMMAPMVAVSDNNVSAGGAKKPRQTTARGTGPRAEVVDLTTPIVETKTAPAVAPKRTRAPKAASITL